MVEIKVRKFDSVLEADLAESVIDRLFTWTVYSCSIEVSREYDWDIKMLVALFLLQLAVENLKNHAA